MGFLEDFLIKADDFVHFKDMLSQKKTCIFNSKHEK